MAESPDLIPQNERTRRLAERFGMTREDVEHLLSATHAEYSTSALPPSEIEDKPPIERAAETISEPIVSASPTSVSNSRIISHAKPLSGGVIVGIFVALLIALGIALSFREGCFEQRRERIAQKPVDTVQRMLDSASEQASAPRTPTQVPPGQLPPESTTIPQESPTGTTGPPTPSSALHAKRKTSKTIYTTSSEFQAQEKLAELRADGNSRARIHANRRNGSITYRVMAN